MDEVQQFNINHAEILGTLNKQLIEDEGHNNPMTVWELASRMTHWLANGYTCYGIARSGQPVAYALYRDDGDCFYLRQLVTSRDFRNQGLASKIMEYMQIVVFVEKPVKLEVLAGNAPALEFYRKRGFKLYCHTLTNRA